MKICDIKMLIAKEYEGNGTWYRIAWGEKEDDLICAYEDVISNYEGRDDFGENQDIVEDVQNIRDSEEATEEFLSSFSFYDGYGGFESVVYAKGFNILQAALDFYNEICSSWWRNNYKDNYPDDVEKEKKVIQNAIDNTENTEALIDLLTMLDELISYNNDCQY